MKNRMTLLCILLAAGSAMTLPADRTSWEERAKSRKNVSKAAQKLNDMARGSRVARNVRDHLEHLGRVVDYALKQEQLTGSEKRRVDTVRRNIERYLDRIDEEGELSSREAQRLYAEITRGYHLLWFLRRNSSGKKLRMSILGKEIALREEYQKKADRNALSKEEMADILKAYHKALRIRDRVQMISLPPDRKRKMEESCFRVLSEYFDVIEKSSSN